MGHTEAVGAALTGLALGAFAEGLIEIKTPPGFIPRIYRAE